MLTVTRRVVREIRSVLRRLVPDRANLPKIVTFRADSGSLIVEAHADEIAARFRTEGGGNSGTVQVPLAALADCEGKETSPVELTAIDGNQVRVAWTQAGVPQCREYPVTPSEVVFPEKPTHWTSMPTRLFEVLKNATDATAQENIRYAISRVQLRGSVGEVVGTDTHQLLIEGGFTFPWKDDILIPKSPLFGLKEFAGEAVKLGRTTGHVCFQIGEWTFAFAIDAKGRYPDFSTIVPKLSDRPTSVTLDAAHRLMLEESLDALPAAKEDHRPVTLDVNGHVSVRSQEAGQPATELILEGAVISGPPVRTAMDRNYLNTVARLGFDRLHLSSPESTMLAVSTDLKRKFMWMPLDKSNIVPSSPGDRRVETKPVSRLPKPSRIVEKSNRIVEQPQPAQKTKPVPSNPSATADLIAEAGLIQTGLRDLLARVRNLTRQIRKQRQQARLMRTTIASLKQLQPLA